MCNKKSRTLLGSAAKATKIAEDRDREAACASHGNTRRLPACGALEGHLLPEPAASGRAAEEAAAAQQGQDPGRGARIHGIKNSERFWDMPPRQIWATLLNEGT